MLTYVKTGIKDILRRVGYKLIKVNDLPSSNRVKMLRHHGIEVVVDVGANVGQYGSELRDLGYTGRIISFEPTSKAYEKLTARVRKDPLWAVNNVAIGEFDGEAVINVAANEAASSSLLPMLALHEQCAPDARNIAQERVVLKTLDTALDGVLEPSKSILLKIDTQGYEHLVLRGASNVLSKVQLIECELSFVPLYEGQLLFGEMLALLRGYGFMPVQFVPAFSDPHTGHNLQVDGIFARSAVGNSTTSGS